MNMHSKAHICTNRACFRRSSGSGDDVTKTLTRLLASIHLMDTRIAHLTKNFEEKSSVDLFRTANALIDEARIFPAKVTAMEILRSARADAENDRRFRGAVTRNPSGWPPVPTRAPFHVPPMPGQVTPESTRTSPAVMLGTTHTGDACENVKRRE